MSNKTLRFTSKKVGFALCITLLAGAQWVHAQSVQDARVHTDTTTTNVIYRFQYDGLVPSGYSHGDTVFDELIQGADGNFYGTTTLGGSGTCLGPFGVQGCGAVFKITPSGTQTVLFNFPYDPNTNTAVDGIYPYGGLVQGKDGNFYGTTSGGGNAGGVCNGTLGCGVIFKITPTGTFTLLHTFNGAFATLAEGGVPTGRLILGSDGNFYGTTNEGGLTADNIANQGTIFRVSPNGAFTTLLSFEGVNNGFTDPAHPYAGLIQGRDGKFYGTSEFGGTSGVGTVFSYSSAAGLKVLHSFPEQAGQVFPDGELPLAALVQASDGKLYGTASDGGALSTFFQRGTLFRITTQGVFTKLWDFNSTGTPLNGFIPYGGLIQASDGNLYGTTQAGGGTANSGTVYELTLGGVLSQVMSFDSTTSGAVPEGVPLQAADGTLYITASADGGSNLNQNDGGTIVQIVGGLPQPKPVVLRFSPASGMVGQKVTISGSNFVGTTSVTFNGTAATFKVKSTNTVTATVPSGATSGRITVTSAGGSTTSAQSFTVVP